VSGQDLIADSLAPIADSSLGFTVSQRHARGRVVRLDASLNAILSAHDYPPLLAQTLAEALVLTALLGATLQPDTKADAKADATNTGIRAGQLTLQAQSKGGAVDLLVCDYHAGALRGYLRHDPERFTALIAANPAPDLAALFGTGHLAITLEPSATRERYQGIVALEGNHLTDAATHYFRDSEQLPTLIRAAVSGDAATGWIAGGLLIQHLGRSEIGGARLDVAEAHPDWQHVATLAATATDAELTDPTLPEESLLWRLFHEEAVHVVPGVPPVRGCRCTLAHYQTVLGRFAESERAEMRGPDGKIGVDCAFCARHFAVEA
jgi:molecular chaperone Hsp33